MLLHRLRCYTLCFIFAICATELVKVKATTEPNEVNNQIMKTKDEDDTEVEVTDHDESKEKEIKDEPTQSTPKEIKPTPDGDKMLKKDFETIKPSIDSAENFVHIVNMTEIPGFNYSPTEMAKFKIWLHGVIPFFIDEFSYDKILRDKIREYLDSTNSLTGLQFLELPKPPDDDRTRWVFFVNRRGQLNCTDYNHDSFTDSGVQKVVLGYDCLVGRREMAALVLALAGVPPQHNSPDRDKYIEVSMKSVQPDKTSLFKAVSPHQWIFYDIKYDFLSAGHYPSHKYTVDGSATITARNKYDEPVGESEDFSYSDLKKIRMLYNYIASESNKNLKLPDCRILYRPGSNFKNPKLVRPQKHARKKPQQYIEATKKVGEKILDGKFGREEEKQPDLKVNPNTSDENKIKNNNVEVKDGESDVSLAIEKQVDIISNNENVANGTNKNAQGTLKNIKKRYAPIDPLKWDDIRTYESD